MNVMLNRPLTDEEIASLTPHEEAVMELITRLEGFMIGYPDSPRKLYNVTKAWAVFVSLEPHHVKLNPDYERLISPEEAAAAKAPSMWREGVIPGEWLIENIRQTCKFMPAPVEAREMYWNAGFDPLDGKRPQRLDGSDRQVSQE